MPLSAFASYRDVEEVFGWMTFLFFVWGILNIILFFKIWGATNDIDKLKSTICDKTQTTDKSNYLRKMYLLNKPEEAYEFLNERFTDEILAIYKECINKSNAEGSIYFGSLNIPMHEFFERRKKDIIENYKFDYASFGKTIPTKLMEIKIEDLQEIAHR